MMTTMAALLGAVPIALGYGAGGEARRPLGLTVVGGLLFSQLITLYLTPVVYTYMAAIVERWRARKQTPRAGAGGGYAMNISETFIRRPIATSLLMAGHRAVRVVAYRALAGQRPAQRRLPHAAGHGQPARRQPGDHGERRWPRRSKTSSP